MENQNSKQKQIRVYKTPLLVPLSVIMVILIYVGYIYFFFTSEETGVFAVLKNLSFEVFIFCELGILSMIIYNKRKLDKFINVFPVIETEDSLEILKPIIRTNMYSSLFSFFFMALASLTAVMTIFNQGGIMSLIVIVLSVLISIFLKWYKPTEERVKHITCTNELLASELDEILDCWVHKLFPKF